MCTTHVLRVVHSLYEWLLLLLLYMQKLCVLRPRKNVVSATSIYTQYWNVYRKYRKKKLCRFLTEWLTWLSDRPSCLPACLLGYKATKIAEEEKKVCAHIRRSYIHTYIHLQYYFTVFFSSCSDCGGYCRYLLLLHTSLDITTERPKAPATEQPTIRPSVQPSIHLFVYLRLCFLYYIL